MKLSIRDIDYDVQQLRDKPEGPPLILLHGFMGSRDSFAYLVPHLGDDLNIILVDLLGHGKTGHASSPARFKVDQQLKDLEIIIRRLGLSTYYLFGYSMGGRLALRYALKNAVHTDGLILESTHEGIGDPDQRLQRRQVDKRWARQLMRDQDSFLAWWRQLDLFEASSTIPEERLTHYHSIQSAQDPEQMGFSLEGFGQGQLPSVRDELSSLQIPVLLGSGQYDHKYIRRMHDMQQQLPLATHHIIEGAAHRIHLDAPERWAEYMDAFINRK